MLIIVNTAEPISKFVFTKTRVSDVQQSKPKPQNKKQKQNNSKTTIIAATTKIATTTTI